MKGLRRNKGMSSGLGKSEINKEKGRKKVIRELAFLILIACIIIFGNYNVVLADDEPAENVSINYNSTDKQLEIKNTGDKGYNNCKVYIYKSGDTTNGKELTTSNTNLPKDNGIITVDRSNIISTIENVSNGLAPSSTEALNGQADYDIVMTSDFSANEHYKNMETISYYLFTLYKPNDTEGSVRFGEEATAISNDRYVWAFKNDSVKVSAEAKSEYVFQGWTTSHTTPANPGETPAILTLVEPSANATAVFLEKISEITISGTTSGADKTKGTDTMQDGETRKYSLSIVKPSGADYLPNDVVWNILPNSIKNLDSISPESLTQSGASINVKPTLKDSSEKGEFQLSVTVPKYKNAGDSEKITYTATITVNPGAPTQTPTPTTAITAISLTGTTPKSADPEQGTGTQKDGEEAEYTLKVTPSDAPYNYSETEISIEGTNCDLSTLGIVSGSLKSKTFSVWPTLADGVSTGSYTINISVPESPGSEKRVYYEALITVKRSIAPTPTVTPTPSVSPTPTPTATPSATPTPVPLNILTGDLNNKTKVVQVGSALNLLLKDSTGKTYEGVTATADTTNLSMGEPYHSSTSGAWITAATGNATGEAKVSVRTEKPYGEGTANFYVADITPDPATVIGQVSSPVTVTWTLDPTPAKASSVYKSVVWSVKGTGAAAGVTISPTTASTTEKATMTVPKGVMSGTVTVTAKLYDAASGGNLVGTLTKDIGIGTEIVISLDESTYVTAGYSRKITATVSPKGDYDYYWEKVDNGDASKIKLKNKETKTVTIEADGGSGAFFFDEDEDDYEDNVAIVEFSLLDFPNSEMDMFVEVYKKPTVSMNKNSSTVTLTGTLPKKVYTDKANIGSVTGGYYVLTQDGSSVYSTTATLSSSSTSQTVNIPITSINSALASRSSGSELKARVYPVGGGYSSSAAEIYGEAGSLAVGTVVVEGPGIVSKTYHGVEGSTTSITASSSASPFRNWYDGGTSPTRSITFGASSTTLSATAGASSSMMSSSSSAGGSTATPGTPATGGSGGDAGSGYDSVPKTGEGNRLLYIMLAMEVCAAAAAAYMFKAMRAGTETAGSDAEEDIAGGIIDLDAQDNKDTDSWDDI